MVSAERAQAEEAEEQEDVLFEKQATSPHLKAAKVAEQDTYTVENTDSNDSNFQFWKVKLRLSSMKLFLAPSGHWHEAVNTTVTYY